jgi:hypothetical protein
MLDAESVGLSSSFEKFQSETVIIPDIQTLCFWLIKDPITIPATLIKNPAN